MRKNHIKKMLRFINLFDNGKIYDIKLQENWQGTSVFKFNGEYIDDDGPGNILYGYIGKLYGYSDNILRTATGFNQIWGKGSKTHLAWMILGNGDDPTDQENINRGIEFYKMTKSEGFGGIDWGCSE